MAKWYYAYLPALMKIYMYEMVSDDFDSWENILAPF